MKLHVALNGLLLVANLILIVGGAFLTYTGLQQLLPDNPYGLETYQQIADPAAFAHGTMVRALQFPLGLAALVAGWAGLCITARKIT